MSPWIPRHLCSLSWAPFSLSVLMNIWAQVDNPVTSPPTLLSYSNIPFWLENKTSLSHIDCHLKVMNRVRFRASLRSFTLFLVCTRRSLKFESGMGQKSWDEEISVLKTSKYLKPSWLKCSTLKYLPALKKVRKLLVLRGFKNESEFS